MAYCFSGRLQQKTRDNHGWFCPCGMANSLKMSQNKSKWERTAEARPDLKAVQYEAAS